MASTKSRLDGLADLTGGATTGADVSGNHVITPHTKPSNLTLWDSTKDAAPDAGAQSLALAELQARRAAKIVKEDTPAGLSE